MSTQHKDIDFQSSIVSPGARKSTLSMFMIMMGFTFFSASMWVGQEMARGLNFTDFIIAMILGGIILVLGYFMNRKQCFMATQQDR